MAKVTERIEVTDRMAKATERTIEVTERRAKATERIEVTDRMAKATERRAEATDRKAKVTDSNRSNGKNSRSDG